MSDPEDPPQSSSKPEDQSQMPAKHHTESDSSSLGADTKRPSNLDALSLAALLLPVPWYVWGVGVVYWVSTLVVDAPWARTIVGVWLLSGVVMLWQPIETTVARLTFRLREPIQSETAKLAGPLAAVMSSAAVADARYSLLVDESDEACASGSGGRIVAVTRKSLTHPRPQLEAILAHELGHHVDGYGSLRAVGVWYTLPARAATWVIRNLGWVMRAAPLVGCLISGFLALSLLGIILAALISDYVPFAIFGIVLFFLAPVILAWFDRMGEKNADKVAARWGYGPALLEVLNEVHAQEQGSKRGGVLASQPGTADRIRALERYVSRMSR